MMRLLLIGASSISGFLAISLLFFQATRKTYPGFGLWTAGVGVLALGYLSLALRGLIPDLFSIVVGNMAFPLGMLLHLDGIRRFLGLTPMSKAWYGVAPAVLGALAIFYYLQDAPVWRNVVVSVPAAIVHWVMAYLIFLHPGSRRSMFYAAIGSLLTVAGFVLLARALWLLSMADFSLLRDSPVQFAFFLSLIILHLGECLSLMMLNSERVENELMDAQADLKLTVQGLENALAEVKTLSGLLPICANCKKIRDDQGYWRALEHFVEEHSQAQFSHGICPDCLKRLYPQHAEEILADKSRRN